MIREKSRFTLKKESFVLFLNIHGFMPENDPFYWFGESAPHIEKYSPFSGEWVRAQWTRRNNNVILTSKWRLGIVLT